MNCAGFVNEEETKLTFVDIESDGSHCYTDHTLWMVEELDGLCIQCKVIGVLSSIQHVIVNKRIM